MKIYKLGDSECPFTWRYAYIYLKTKNKIEQDVAIMNNYEVKKINSFKYNSNREYFFFMGGPDFTTIKTLNVE